MRPELEGACGRLASTTGEMTSAVTASIVCFSWQSWHAGVLMIVFQSVTVILVRTDQVETLSGPCLFDDGTGPDLIILLLWGARTGCWSVDSLLCFSGSKELVL